MRDGGVVVAAFETSSDAMFCSNRCRDFAHASCLPHKWITTLRKKASHKHRHRVSIVHLLLPFSMRCFAFGKVIHFCCSGNSGERTMMLVLDEDQHSGRDIRHALLVACRSALIPTPSVLVSTANGLDNSTGVSSARTSLLGQFGQRIWGPRGGDHCLQFAHRNMHG